MSSAPKGYTHATGKGRDSRGSRRVVDVETVKCPERDGPHWLINRRGKTVCRGCGQTWATLDAELRAS